MITRLDGHADQAGAWDVLADATGAVAWDVGANIGQSTRVLAQNFDLVVAFEPCTESFDILAGEMPGHVECLNVAVSDHMGKVRLAEMSRSIRTGQLTSGEGLSWGEYLRARVVPCITLDSLLADHDPPQFLKVDVEGHEVEVIRGAHRLLAQHRPRVIVEIHRKENGPAVANLLYGYDLTELRHGDYVPRHSHTWRNHYWLVAEPKG